METETQVHDEHVGRKQHRDRENCGNAGCGQSLPDPMPHGKDEYGGLRNNGKYDHVAETDLPEGSVETTGLHEGR